MSEMLEGGCLCGAVRYEVENRTTDAGYCHCRMCQKNTGAPVVAYASFGNEAKFRWTKGEPKIYESSAEGRRIFCAECGSYLAFATTLYPDEISLNTVTLDRPETIPPRRHIFVGTRVPWFETKDELPRSLDYDKPL